MKAGRASLFVLIACTFLMAAQVTRADLDLGFGQSEHATWCGSPRVAVSPGTLRGARDAQCQRLTSAFAVDFGADRGPGPNWALDSVSGSLAYDFGLADSGRSGDEVVREFPPLPSSASLFLSGMLSIGAWHLVRSARHLHFGALPEWYHTGGPFQVGHAVPFDLDLSALPLCCFEQPVGEGPFLYPVRREQTPRCDAQSIFPIIAPRGPPLLS